LKGSQSLESESRVSRRLLEDIKATPHPAEIDLIGPGQLRRATSQFAERVQGEVIWFNACPEMLENKELCGTISNPFLANPEVTTIRFVLAKAEEMGRRRPSERLKELQRAGRRPRVKSVRELDVVAALMRHRHAIWSFRSRGSAIGRRRTCRLRARLTHGGRRRDEFPETRRSRGDGHHLRQSPPLDTQ
jgi:hypothetical protein